MKLACCFGSDTSKALNKHNLHVTPSTISVKLKLLFASKLKVEILLLFFGNYANQKLYQEAPQGSGSLAAGALKLFFSLSTKIEL